MTTESREHLSCLMDGEISRETGRFLVRRLGADEELCATWARYHVVRDCLRNGDGGVSGEDLSRRVRQALERESPPAAARRSLPSWLKPVTGVAMAASVALMAIVAVGPGRQASPEPASSLAEGAPAAAFTSPQSLTPSPVSRQASLSGGQTGDSRMNAYLLRHYQATGSNGGQGFVTFVPIVITPSAQAGNAAPEQVPDQARARESGRSAQPEEAVQR
jgi:sigma-E factor negative regulatory protein RseA